MSRQLVIGRKNRLFFALAATVACGLIPARLWAQDDGFRNPLQDSSQQAALGVTLAREPRPGVLILAVSPNGPADVTGLRPGDVILEINHQPVLNYTDVMRLIAASKPGSKVLVFIDRDGLQGPLSATLATQEAVARLARSPSRFQPRPAMVVDDSDGNPEHPPGYRASEADHPPYSG